MAFEKLSFDCIDNIVLGGLLNAVTKVCAQNLRQNWLDVPSKLCDSLSPSKGEGICTHRGRFLCISTTTLYTGMKLPSLKSQNFLINVSMPRLNPSVASVHAQITHFETQSDFLDKLFGIRFFIIHHLAAK